MAAVAPRGGRARRRAMAEMNMVPFIDVMLVLLIIFMVSAPLITTGLVDLPSVGKAKTQPPHVVEVVVGSDEKLRLRIDGGEPQPVTFNRLAAEVKKLQAGDAQVPVVISADKNVKYDAVVRAMDSLLKNGIARVGLAVRQGG